MQAAFEREAQLAQRVERRVRRLGELAQLADAQQPVQRRQHLLLGVLVARRRERLAAQVELERRREAERPRRGRRAAVGLLVVGLPLLGARRLVDLGAVGAAEAAVPRGREQVGHQAARGDDQRPPQVARLPPPAEGRVETEGEEQRHQPAVGIVPGSLSSAPRSSTTSMRMDKKVTTAHGTRTKRDMTPCIAGRSTLIRSCES